MPDGIGKENRACLSLSDYKKILSALPTKRDQIIVKLFYMGGLRRGELFAIPMEEFRRLLHFRASTNQPLRP